MKPLLLLDFDTTLFKTTNFWNDFAIIFARASGQPDNLYINHYEDLIRSDSNGLIIDYDRLLAHVHLAAESIRLTAKEQMTSKSYIFDDAQYFLDKLPFIRERYDVAILTFGQPTFRNLKIEHAPEITGIPVHITQELKTDYIKEHFSDRSSGVLIDDKPDQNLPDGWVEVHIDRQATEKTPPALIKPSVFRITQLNDAVNIIEKLK